jgi:hypothetical protein
MRRLSFVAVFCSLIALAGCGGSGSGSAPAPIPTYVPPSTGSYVYVTDGGSFVLQILQSQNGAINPASSICPARPASRAMRPETSTSPMRRRIRSWSFRRRLPGT